MLINGINYSWSNIQFVLFGVVVIGIVKIDYKSKQTKTNNYGLGKKPISRGHGNVEYEGSIDIYMDELRAIIDAAPSKDPLEVPMFDVVVLATGLSVLPLNDTLKDVEFMEDVFSFSQGNSKSTVTIPLVIGDIVHG
jgi:hypothetical protein